MGTSPNFINRLTLGGGGGSGDGNNNYQLDMSGGAGGGLIVLKAGTVSGGGSLLADGQAGRTVPELGGNCPPNASNSCDGAGGGGAGGGIVVLASSGTVANASVRGGQGGNIDGTIHGPGGGSGVMRAASLCTTPACQRVRPPSATRRCPPSPSAHHRPRHAL